jgi:hypothetical protein
MIAVIRAAAALGKPCAAIYDQEADAFYQGAAAATPGSVIKQARWLTRHWGAVTVENLVLELEKCDGVVLPVGEARAFLELVPQVGWLDDAHEWFWVKDGPTSRPLRVVEKVMSVARTIDVAELRDGVGRCYRLLGFRPPCQVLVRLCEQTGLYKASGHVVSATTAVPPWQQVLEGADQTIVDILLRHGPVMRRDDLLREALGCGVSRSNALMKLSYSPVLKRHSRNEYGLRGFGREISRQTAEYAVRRSA